MISSVSDNGSYPSVCLLASKDDFFFNTFKQNPTYTLILEHTSYYYGNEYLNILKSRYSKNDLINLINKVKINDNFGSASIQKFTIENEDIYVSPSTLNYSKVWSDICNLFGNRTDLKVCEIGGGYGGQATVAYNFTGFKQWDIVDLAEAAALQNRYLNHLGVKNANAYSFKELNKLLPEYDLCISNFAFSEVQRDLQEIYINEILLKSKNGYMIMNFGWDLTNMVTVDDLKSKIPSLIVTEEVPKTAASNCLVHW